MTTNAAQLLHRLGSGIRPAASCPSNSASAVAPGVGAFADLLTKAREGGLASELPVTIGSDAESAGVRLNDEQLARLAIAADQLETAGVRTALVTIDGQKLLLDVHGREITGRPEGAGGLVGGIDGTIDLGDTRAGVAPGGASGAQAAPAAGRRIGPPTPMMAGSASAIKLLATVARDQPRGAGS